MTAELESDRPAIRMAYEFIEPSYSWAISRWDSLHMRVDRLLTFSAALIVGAPLIDAALIDDAEDPAHFLVVAIVLFVVHSVAGFYALKGGELRLLNVRTIFNDTDWLNSGEYEFKRDLLESASEDFRDNISDINRKAQTEILMIALLALQTGFLALWIVL